MLVQKTCAMINFMTLELIKQSLKKSDLLRLSLPLGAWQVWVTCHVHAGVVGVCCKQVDSHGSGPGRMEGNSWEEGQRVVPRRGVENAVNLKLIYHHHRWVMGKNVKASENAKLPKRSVKGHKFRVLRKIKLNFRCKKVVLLSINKQGEN